MGKAISFGSDREAATNESFKLAWLSISISHRRTVTSFSLTDDAIMNECVEDVELDEGVVQQNQKDDCDAEDLSLIAVPDAEHNDESEKNQSNTSNFLIQNHGFLLFLCSKTLRINDKVTKLPANRRKSASKFPTILLLKHSAKILQHYATNGNVLPQSVAECSKPKILQNEM